MGPAPRSSSGGSVMRRAFLVLAAAAVIVSCCVFWVTPSSASTSSSTSTPVVTFGPSDARSVAVLSGQPGYKNSYWWDHTALTVAVRSGGNARLSELGAIHDAIALWQSALASRFPRISL